MDDSDVRSHHTPSLDDNSAFGLYFLRADDTMNLVICRKNAMLSC